VVETSRAKALADEYSIMFIEVSAKNSIRVQEAFLAIAQNAKKRLVDDSPSRAEGLRPSSPQLALTKPMMEEVASFAVVSIFDMERCITITKRQELIVTGSTDSLTFRLSSYPTLFKPPRCMIDINEHSSCIILSPNGIDLGGASSKYEHRHRIVIVRLASHALPSLLHYCQRKSKMFLGRIWFGNLSSPPFAQFIIERMAAPLLLDPNKLKTDDEVTMQSIIGPFLYSKCDEKSWPLRVIVDVAAASPSIVTSTSSGANDWVPDAMASSCTLCSSKFTFFTRRHHCRRCGHVVCNGCSKRRRKVAGTDQRICDACEKLLNKPEDYHVTYDPSPGPSNSPTKQNVDSKEPMMMDTKQPITPSSRALSPSTSSRPPAWLDPKVLRSLEFGELSLSNTPCRALTHSLYWNSTLLRLHITQSYLSPQHLTWLIDSIIDHPVLEELVLQHNDINHTSGNTIARYLTRAPSLKILDISFNNIGDGASVIFEALPFARQLRELYIEYNGIGSSTATELPSRISSIAWAALAASISKTEMLPLRIISINGNLLDLTACRAIASPFASRGAPLANRGSLELRIVDTNMSLSDMKIAAAYLVAAGITTISERKKGPAMSMTAISEKKKAMPIEPPLHPAPVKGATIAPVPVVPVKNRIIGAHSIATPNIRSTPIAPIVPTAPDEFEVLIQPIMRAIN
jgi:hypothetical protein